MKLSDLLMNVPSDRILQELFPNQHTYPRRPQITHSDLQILSLWLQGYSAAAIAQGLTTSMSYISTIVRTTRYNLVKAKVVMDIEREPAKRASIPPVENSWLAIMDKKDILTDLNAQAELKIAQKQCRKLAQYILQSPDLEGDLCNDLRCKNSCPSTLVVPFKRHSVCLKCVLDNIERLSKTEHRKSYG